MKAGVWKRYASLAQLYSVCSLPSREAPPLVCAASFYTRICRWISLFVLTLLSLSDLHVLSRHCWFIRVCVVSTADWCVCRDVCLRMGDLQMSAKQMSTCHSFADVNNFFFFFPHKPTGYLKQQQHTHQKKKKCINKLFIYYFKVLNISLVRVVLNKLTNKQMDIFIETFLFLFTSSIKTKAMYACMYLRKRIRANQ